MTETLECRRCGKPTQYNFCSQECAKSNNEAMAEGYDAQGNQTYASPEAIRGMLDKEVIVEYGKSEYGHEFPMYDGKLLSWSLDLTSRDEQEGFPRLRTVIRAMVERRPGQLERERIDMVKGSFDPMFGPNAKKCLQIIDDELARQ